MILGGSMQVIPGIDLIGNKCVCAVHRSFAEDAPASHDPAEVASEWTEQGAPRLYIADLDGARMGQPRNLEALKKIIAATPVPVDFGGGIRTLEIAQRVIDLGVDRLVIGTAAALDEPTADALFSTYGDRIVLSIASLNRYVVVSDWQARTDERVDDFARRMVKRGAKRIVFTDVSRKGLHGSVNIRAIRRMAESLSVPIIASGGVSSLQDLKDLKRLEPLGVEGVIMVTALYSGRIRLADAIEVSNADDTEPMAAAS